MAALSRATIPLIVLGLGTWFGLGRPDAQTVFAAGSRVIAKVVGAANAATPSMVPPLDRDPPTVDGSTLPDPPLLPWPAINADERASRAWLLAEGPLHRAGDGRRLITFTFDDGPFPETAPTLLHILGQHHVRAAFFFIGKYLEGNDSRAVESRRWAKRIADAGHFIGNHTLDHKVLTGLSHAAALAEIDDSAAVIEHAIGRRPWLFRPPYGELDPWLEQSLRDRHLELLLWSIDAEDMKRSDPSAIAQSLQQQLEYDQGGIVLLHDVHWPSVKAFNRLLRWIEASRWDAAHPSRPGWDIVDLGEYLRATAASPQPFETRAELELSRKAMLARSRAGDAAQAISMTGAQ
ncbi:MAG: polysaccharide deacetylase family protein [Myxococcota bacterium]|nr:polysaccharide deacetylase family protein [Myxococcota bacterium]